MNATGAATMILSGRTLVPMDPACSVIPEGAIAIAGDTIVATGTRTQLRARYPHAPETALGDCLLMPGLINAHAHSGMLRGTAEQLPVWDWLTQHINPMHKVLQPVEAHASARLCYAESLLSGTTTLVDMWRFMDGCCKAAQELGIRLVAVPYVGTHPDYDYFESLDENEALLERWQDGAQGRIRVWVGLEHPFYTDDAGWRRAVDMARRHGTGLHTHCSEARIEVAEFLKRYGKKPMHALAAHGFFDTPHALVAHGVWIDEEEIAFLAGKAVAVSHNPVSNMKLASGIARVEAMRAAGIPVGLGTDGEKENNNFDMFEELKAASLLAKLREHDAAALPAWEALKMGTIDGARALGLADRTGSIEPGKQADIIAIDTRTPRMTPYFDDGPNTNLAANLVHAVRGSDVRMTMVAGTIVARDGQLLTGSMADILAGVDALAPGLFARRAAFLEAHREGLVQWVAG